MKGHGGGYDQDAWRRWLVSLDGFLVPDISEFPSVDVFLIEVDEVLDYFQGGERLPELGFREFQDFSERFLETDSDSEGEFWEEAV